MYDFVIIGGGIIGMSTAMQLIDVYPDARIALPSILSKNFTYYFSDLTPNKS